MATVFLAQDLKHKRPVALKVLHPELGHALGPERFQREVELAARLQHPHILTVFDSGEAAGQLWFTMPFVEGESLRDRLNRETQLPVEDAVRIAIEAARALEYAHQHGVIHRDIKPENILLTTDGSTLVADFGIARALSGDVTSLTETGMAVGTPAYMSPEQASGERTLDARTDIYALGCVLYEMLAGEPPFTGPTVQAIISKRMRGEVPDVRSARSTVPKPVGDAVNKALAPVPADRFASAADLVKALSAASTTGFTAARPSTGATRSEAPGARPARRIPAGFALLLVGFLVGVGVLFAWRRGSHTTSGTGRKVIAVLPFENQGDTAQAYFADGITDEVRGKLTGLPGLQVIASASSAEYRASSKPLEKIGDELGADYLLVAKVRWARGADGTLQVRVSPELVALQGGKPTSQWQKTFDASLTNVFQVQADIAGQVAQALDVALTDSVSQELVARPTGNFPAYDAYLRAEQIGSTVNSPPGIRRALVYFRQAVALDPNFALAWAEMARYLSYLYAISTPTKELAEEARKATDRAVALDPTLVEANLAEVGYAMNVLGDAPRALAAIRRGLVATPNDPQLVSRMANLMVIAGQWDSALVYGQRATRLDPRSANAITNVVLSLQSLHRFPESLRESRRARALQPENMRAFQGEVLSLLAMGDLAGAQAVIRNPPPGQEPAALVAFLATYEDLYWVLDEPQQQLLFTLGPSEFDNDRGLWSMALTEAWWLRGDRTRARAYADSAVIALTQQLRERPDVQRGVILGLALAYTGSKAEAVRQAEAGIAEARRRDNPGDVMGYTFILARIYLVSGDPEKAIDQLEAIVAGPSYVSRDWLRIDPRFASLKGNPRFDRLIASH